MMIPSASLQIGPVPYGQDVSLQHAQFGKVELSSDGCLDDRFQRSGARDLNSRELRGALITGGQVARNSLSVARQNFENGLLVDRHTLASQHEQAVRQGLGELPASVYTTTDHRGVMTEARLHLHSQKFSYDSVQFVTIGPSQARIETRHRDGLHTLTVPFLPDGSLDLARSTEQVVLNTPWLSNQALSDVPERGITRLDDPRLERIAQAVDNGFLLNPNEMGTGWECSLQGNRQTFTTPHETLVLDATDRSFTLSAVSSHTGHAGSGDDIGTDYDVAESVKWQNGKFQRV